jgi:hypothetical protein
MKKQILIIIFVSIFLIGGIFLNFIFKKSEEIVAGTGDNVWGFAWAENIGWIKFNNCTDPANSATCGAINYGVTIDPSTGNFSGYAWSENIGWIRFDPPGPYPASPNYSARVDLSTAKLSGWARAIAGGTPEAGGWDGWIKLRGTNHGVWIDTSVSPAEFRDWGWGGDPHSLNEAVIGWVSFNRINCDSDKNGVTDRVNFPQCPLGQPVSDYKVMTSLTFNQPPVASITCCPNGCANPPGACRGYRGTFCLRNDSTDPDGNLQNSIWTIVETGYTSNCLVISGSPICNLTPDLPTDPSTPITYTAQLRAIDSEGAEDVKQIRFDLLQDIQADFKCSLASAGPWQACNAFKVTVGERVYFKDESVASTGATINSWSWTFQDGNPASSTQQSPSTQFQSHGSKNVTLTVTDDAIPSRSDTATKTLNVRRLPIWFPIPPR